MLRGSLTYVLCLVGPGTVRRAGGVPIGGNSSGQWTAVLWRRIERLTDTIHSCCLQIWHLERVLLRLMTQHSTEYFLFSV